MLAAVLDSTCDPATVLSQLMDLTPLFAFLLVDGHHVVVGAYCNLWGEIGINIPAPLQYHDLGCIITIASKDKTDTNIK